MLETAYSIFVIVAAVVGIGWILYMLRHGDSDRHDEDAARTFFDEHGHWPDETPEEAEAERRRLAAAAAAHQAPTSQASSDGLV